MRSGLDYLLDQIKAFTKTKPPYNAAFTTQALYLLNQCTTVMQGLNEIIHKQKTELEGKKPVKVQKPKGQGVIAKPDRNQALLEDEKAGLTHRQMAEKYQISMGRVSQIIMRARIQNGEPRVKGLSNRSHSKRQGLAEGGQEAGDPANAHGIG